MEPKISLTTWVKRNRKRIDAVMRAQTQNPIYNDKERALWVEKDEFLYNLAKFENVNLEE